MSLRYWRLLVEPFHCPFKGIVSNTFSEIDICPFNYFCFIYVWHCSVNNRYVFVSSKTMLRFMIMVHYFLNVRCSNDEPDVALYIRHNTNNISSSSRHLSDHLDGRDFAVDHPHSIRSEPSPRPTSSTPAPAVGALPRAARHRQHIALQMRVGSAAQAAEDRFEPHRED